jgi:hypothetical protein
MKHTEETKQKIRDKILAINSSLTEEERKAKYGISNLGRKHTEEQNKRKSELIKSEYASGKRKPFQNEKSIKSLMSEESWKLRNERISSTRKERYKIGEIIQTTKGKTYNELFSPEKALELKRNISVSKSGNNSPMRNPESREKMTNSIKLGWKNGRKPPLNNTPKGGFREDIGHYVRCKWEANFCRILKYLNKDYEYESMSFTVIENDIEYTYIPDIRIKNTDIFIEIKGRQIGIQKYKLFKEQYKNYFLGFIDLQKYNILKKKYKNIIPNWE